MQILSHLINSLRWMAAHVDLTGIDTLTPHLWYDYLEARLAAGNSPVSLNNELRRLKAFLLYL